MPSAARASDPVPERATRAAFGLSRSRPAPRRARRSCPLSEAACAVIQSQPTIGYLGPLTADRG